MSAGEEKVMRLEVDLSSDNSPKDWSVVAYGNAGNLSITHNEGLTSKSMPFIGSVDSTPSGGDDSTGDDSNEDEE